MITVLAVFMGFVVGFAIAVNLIKLGALRAQKPGVGDDISQHNIEIVGTLVSLVINLFLLIGIAILHANIG